MVLSVMPRSKSDRLMLKLTFFFSDLAFSIGGDELPLVSCFSCFIWNKFEIFLNILSRSRSRIIQVRRDCCLSSFCPGIICSCVYVLFMNCLIFYYIFWTLASMSWLDESDSIKILRLFLAISLEWAVWERRGRVTFFSETLFPCFTRAAGCFLGVIILASVTSSFFGDPSSSEI